MSNEIDNCIICNRKEPQNEFRLSNRLSARLKYVTGVLPDLSDLGSLFGTVADSTPVDSSGISIDEGRSPGISIDEGRSPGISIDEGRSPGISIDEAHSPGISIDEAHSPGISMDEAHSPGISIDEAHSPGISIDEAHSPGISIDESHSPGISIDEGHSPGISIDEGHSPGISIDEGHSPGISIDEGHSPGISIDEGHSPEMPPSLASVSSSSSSDTESLCDSDEDTISAIVSPIHQQNEMPISVTSSLETFYVLKLVFKHPLDHVTTEVMMLLVQSPADWFEICPSCRFLVCEGIELVNALKECGRRDKRQHEELKDKLETNLYHIRSKFVSSMFQRICLVSWEFLDLEDFSNVKTINFLKTEAEAVLSFRHILLTTALQRVINLVNISQLALPIEDCIMDFSYSPAYSPEILIDSDTPDEDPSNQLDDLEHEIGLPDWFAEHDEELDDEIFCDCLGF